MPPHQSDPKSGVGTNLKLTAYKEFPTNYPHHNVDLWLSGKRIDDNVGPYWRIHNKLYDLTDFVDRHPGGRMWLEVTKGTDITEAFESSHVSESAEKLLKKFYVKDISTPRNSPYTFHEDGFYKTFKRKVQPILKEIGTGPSWKTLVIQDGLALALVVLTVACSVLSSYTLAAFAGVFLSMVITCAHNFFHQKDNWRMHYFDLSFSTAHEWRVSHALSHHLYTNTANDIEISTLEPLWEFLPKPDKNLLQRYGSIVYDLVLVPLVPLCQHVLNIYAACVKGKALPPGEFAQYSVLIMISIFSQSFWLALRLFMALHLTAYFVFLFIGLTAAHHHPDIFHDGDKMRDNPDWGLCQLDAVRDRMEVTGNLLMVLTTFGEHTLHHLLPTVDHSKLNSLYPVFLETCKEFNIPFSFMNWPTLFAGKYLQMANITPNSNYPGYKVKVS
ncbi:cytochrome b5-related protein-like [Scylla paramamosain]|uniref:cytochrome b5-related protein-like n=1 Tax=Scylla paramamosain TaxID=85552 RepID=UPI0030838A0F